MMPSFSSRKSRFAVRLMSGALVWCTLQSGIAHAAFAPTAMLQTEQTATDSRDRLQQALTRSDVQERLQALGVSPSVAAERVAALSEAEIRQLDAHFDQMPAGGDVLGTIILVLLVLVFTDLVGLTDVFPGVRTL